MSGEPNSTMTRVAERDAINLVDDVLVEDIWRELGKRVTPELVRQVALEIAAEFQDATVMTFIPIFIRRLTYERLEKGVQQS